MSSNFNSVLIPLLYAVLPFFAMVQYISLRIRDTRASPQDPHLGRKSLLYMLFNIAVFTALAGFTLSALEWKKYLFEPIAAAPGVGVDWFSTEQRNAAGLVVSGILHGLLFWIIIRLGTNDRQFPAVGRAAIGMRLAVAALITFYTSSATIMLSFDKEPAGSGLQQTCAIAIVWAPTALVHLVLMLMSSGWQRTRDVAE